MKLDLLKKLKKMLGMGKKKDSWGKRQLREIAKLGGKMVVM